ncbi:unnamed protein product [Bubo scandiacus]
MKGHLKSPFPKTNRRYRPPRQVPQPEVVDISKEAVTITWNSPAQDGGFPVQGSVIEKRKKGINLCVLITKEPVQGQSKIICFEQLCIHICKCRPAGTVMCHSSPAVTEPPGLLKVVDFSNSSTSLAWQEPDQGDVQSGYILEIGVTGRNSSNATFRGAEGKWRAAQTVQSLSQIKIILPSFLLSCPLNVRFDLTVRLKSHTVVCAGTAPCIHTAFPLRFWVVSLSTPAGLFPAGKGLQENGLIKRRNAEQERDFED